MLGALAALAALAIVGEVSYQTVIFPLSMTVVSGIINFHVCPALTEHVAKQCFLRKRNGRTETRVGKEVRLMCRQGEYKNIS